MDNGGKSFGFIPTAVRKRQSDVFNPDAVTPFKKMRKTISYTNVENDGTGPSISSPSSGGHAFFTPPRNSRKSNQFSSPFPNLSPSMFVSSNTEDSGVTNTPRQRRIFKTKDCAECDICSDEVFEVRHPHFSTQKATAKRYGFYYCNLCRMEHSKDSSRLNVLLSSSTLHNLWKNPLYKPNQHIDFDTIIGGRIHDIHASFLYQYSQVSTPMDIILVCGVNNIPTEDSSQNIIIQFKSLIKTIKDHSVHYNHRTENRIVLCTVLYPPKHCDSSFLPPSKNMTQKVREVNAWIHKFNESETGQHLKIHLNGVVGDPDHQDLVFKYEEWNEPDRTKKLHLTNQVKNQIAAQVIEVFRKMKSKD